MTGGTNSTEFPTTPGAFQTAFGGGTCYYGYPCPHAFVTKLNPAGSALVYSTYLGGSLSDGGGAIALDAAGNAYVSGGTNSTNFPTTPGAFQTAYRRSGFVAKFSFQADFSLSGPSTVSTISAGQSATYMVSITPLDGFTDTVALSCAGAPVAASCTVSPASAMITGPDAVTAMVTVSTTARSLLRPKLWWPRGPSDERVGPWGFAFVLLVTLAMLTKLARRHTKPVFVATILLVLLGVACGKSDGGDQRGTPSGNSTLTITGTSSSLSRSTTLSLLVN